jgi:hypothetical protein
MFLFLFFFSSSPEDLSPESKEPSLVFEDLSKDMVYEEDLPIASDGDQVPHLDLVQVSFIENIFFE